MSEKKASYILEVESIKDGALTLMGAQGVLLALAPAPPGGNSRTPITSDQFEALAYDIEGHAEGVYGVPKDLIIWVVNADTQERERISFRQAAGLMQEGLLDQARAHDIQAKRRAQRAPKDPAKAATPPAVTALVETVANSSALSNGPGAS